ncbi:phosphatidylinositol-3-phosphatase myotubularin-1-like isoform X2 [Lolium rigidum]|uniref:phosphatidylinositol-3-phosphatase myotubularin-1-like isoform X2 n=1 Tax=Lolium rigidum TaxID=89674 RepID=UPI001F5D0461|nr:phosphatidylinositol-3-phosphatase myotubularin-1-like isoform X2 [Lolium rigidum]
MEEFRLEHETFCDQGHNVVLLNTNEPGSITVTNFRLLFVSKATKCVVDLGTIPLTAIEELNDAPSEDLKRFLPPDRSIFQVTGRDTRVLVFVFESKNKDMKNMIEYLKKCIKHVHLGHIYPFSSKPPADKVPSQAMLRLLREYHRLFQKWFAHSPSTHFNAQVHLQNKWWRVSKVNSDYALCQTYPAWLIVPNKISDESLWVASTYRKCSRLPAISWFDPGSGAALARSSQLKTQNLAKMEELLCALGTPSIHHTDRPRKLYIVDVRPIVNNVANMSISGGSELSYNYAHTEVFYSGLDDIHVMKDSFRGLREYMNAYDYISSNGATLDQGDPISSWVTQTSKSMADISKLQKWLSHIQNILVNASYITRKITGESASVLVHCSDGSDGTSQLVGLSCLLLDPYYRTFSGFQALVEKDWLAFGHKFAARMGVPTMTAGEGWPNFKLPWHGDSSVHSEESSPIILQWLECIAHLICMYPCAFEFSSKFLVDFMDAILSCRFGNFLCNSEWEREQADVASCPCIWKFLADLRASDTLHEHRNPFYDPEKHNGPIVPPAPALAPTLWPQFYLRWSCPLESHCGGGGYHELVKAKMATQPRRESQSLPADENQPVKGRPIRIVGSNARKL